MSVDRQPTAFTDGPRRSKLLGWLALLALAGIWILLLAVVVAVATLGYRTSFVVWLIGLVAVNVLAVVLRPPISRLNGSLRSFQGAIYFDANWTAHLVTFNGPADSSIEQECRRTLGPVFERCGLT